MRWQRRAAFGAGIVALSLFTGRGASAQTKEELEKARTLFKEGVTLSAANNCPAALTKFRAVANVKMSAQVAYNIGVCEERIGKLVSALGNYRVAASQAEGDPKAKDVSSLVGGKIEALEPRIPKLTIKRGKGADTATIELDGSELGPSQISTEFPVDPGSHTVVAKISGKEYMHETVSLDEKQTKTFEVTLEVPASKVEKSGGEVPPPDEKPDLPPPPKGRSKVPGGVLLGVGGVSVVVGAVFMALRSGTLSDLEVACGGDKACPPSAKPIADKGQLYTGVAEATLAVGAVGIITGIILLATSGPPAAPPKQASKFLGPEGAKITRRLELSPSSPGASAFGLSLIGRF